MLRLREVARIALVASAVAAGVLAVFLALRALHGALLLLFAAVLFAVVLNAFATLVGRSGLPYRWSVGAVVAALLALLAAVGVLAGPDIATQVDELRDRIPQAVDKVRGYMGRHGWSRALLEGSAGGSQGLSSWAGDAAKASLAVVTNAAVVFFVGLFLALEPATYRRGLLSLVPRAGRDLGREMLLDVGQNLRWWLLGRLFTMVVVGTATGLGLWALGVPLALTLGVLAGLFNFVPYVGPIIAGIPAVLLALGEGPSRALWVAVLFLGVQTVEGYVLTPLVDRRTVALPPALTLAAQFSLALLAGGAGIVLASPLLVAALVLVHGLREEDGEEDGEGSRRAGGDSPSDRPGFGSS